LNHVVLIGRLLSDWHYSKTQKDISVASNIIVTAEKKSDGSIAYEHHEITAWGTRADQIIAINKGDRLSIIGKIATSIYTTKTGVERRTKKIHVHKFQIED
jgi:single-stranded DNA-binding protein